MVGIYKITSPTNKVYIGQSRNIENRKGNYVKNVCLTQRKLYNSIKKYGWENHIFETIHKLPLDISQQTLNIYETYYWQQYKDCGFEMMNIREPGSNGKLSDETKIKIGEKSKGNKYLLGYRHSESTKQKMSENSKGDKNGMFGRKHSEKTKMIFSNQRKGLNNSQYGKLNKYRKRILDLENNQIYESILDASKKFNVTRKTIRDWIKKRKKLIFIK